MEQKKIFGRVRFDLRRVELRTMYPDLDDLLVQAKTRFPRLMSIEIPTSDDQAPVDGKAATAEQNGQKCEKGMIRGGRQATEIT